MDTPWHWSFNSYVKAGPPVFDLETDTRAREGSRTREATEGELRELLKGVRR